MTFKMVTGDPILDSAISKVNKLASRDLVLTTPNVKDIAAIRTGSLGLDCAIGIGGIPQGRIVEIYGPESSGKTSLMLAMAKHAQAHDPDRWVLICDIECTMTETFLNGFGLNKDRLLYMKPNSTGEALNSLTSLVRSGRVSFVGFDSIDGLQSDTALDKGVEKADVGGVSKILNRFLREYSKVCDQVSCTSVFINQLKYNPGARPGTNPEVTPGGTAMKFYTSLRLKMLPGKKSETTRNAFRARVRIIKNKCRAPVARIIEFDFIYGQGPDPYLDTMNTAKDLGILAFAGQACKLVDGGEVKQICAGGKEGFIEHCMKHPEVLIQIRDLCMKTQAEKAADAIADIEGDTDDESSEE